MCPLPGKASSRPLRSTGPGQNLSSAHCQACLCRGIATQVMRNVFNLSIYSKIITYDYIMQEDSTWLTPAPQMLPVTQCGAFPCSRRCCSHTFAMNPRAVLHRQSSLRELRRLPPASADFPFQLPFNWWFVGLVVSGRVPIYPLQDLEVRTPNRQSKPPTEG